MSWQDSLYSVLSLCLAVFAVCFLTWQLGRGLLKDVDVATLMRIAMLPLAVLVISPLPLACLRLAWLVLVRHTLPTATDWLMGFVVSPSVAAVIGMLWFVGIHMRLHRRVTSYLRQLIADGQHDAATDLLRDMRGSIWLHKLLAHRRTSQAGTTTEFSFDALPTTKHDEGV